MDENSIVSARFVLPNIRELFIPDPGMTLVDADLDRADLQVVVWEAGDEEMKQMLREGVDIHSENAKVIGLTRQEAKIFCHATNYGAKAKKMASVFKRSVHDMEVAQARWFSAHPGFKDWHERTEDGLPKVENKFGYKIQFFDRPGSVLPKALAWIPQSTVAIVINHGLVALDEQMPEVQLLLQVHDSLVFQLPTDRLDELLPKALELMKITVPYDDPLVIPVSAKVSNKSWGEVEEWKKWKK